MPHAQAELDALQRILDGSATAAAGLLRGTFDPAGHGLSARQIAGTCLRIEPGRGLAWAARPAEHPSS